MSTATTPTTVAPPRLFGVLVFSPGREHILLIERDGALCLPAKPALPGVQHATSALAALRELVGLQLEPKLTRFHLEADVPTATGRQRVKVFVALNQPAVPQDQLALSSDVTRAVWMRTADLLATVPAASGSAAPGSTGAPQASQPLTTEAGSSEAATVAQPAEQHQVTPEGTTAAAATEVPMTEASNAAASSQPTASQAVGVEDLKLVEPFLPKIKLFLEKHPELQQMEDNSELLSCVAWQGAANWQGTTPREHLANYCRDLNYPEPVYSLIVKTIGPNRLLTSSCMLTHKGVQITPEHAAPTREDAEQAAALCALLWLEGALSPHSRHCRITPVGYPPLLAPHQLDEFDDMKRGPPASPQEREERQKALLRQHLHAKKAELAAELAELEAAQNALDLGTQPDRLNMRVRPLVAAGAAFIPPGGPFAPPTMVPLQMMHGVFPALAPPGPTPPKQQRPPKRPRVSNAAAGTPEGAGMEPLTGTGEKNAVQELKELCDRKHWPQPEYNFDAPSSGGFTCTCSLPAAQAAAASPAPVANKRRAKELASIELLKVLAERGLR